jgi:hypothetical protein
MLWGHSDQLTQGHNAQPHRALTYCFLSSSLTALELVLNSHHPLFFGRGGDDTKIYSTSPTSGEPPLHCPISQLQGCPLLGWCTPLSGHCKQDTLRWTCCVSFLYLWGHRASHPVWLSRHSHAVSYFSLVNHYKASLLPTTLHQGRVGPLVHLLWWTWQ